ncbi:MAG: hypothetical protein KDK40_05135 [Chlamydiia bacterium]|nr:hypothetical protein [Chlamydiia bacterium]
MEAISPQLPAFSTDPSPLGCFEQLDVAVLRSCLSIYLATVPFQEVFYRTQELRQVSKRFGQIAREEALCLIFRAPTALVRVLPGVFDAETVLKMVQTAPRLEAFCGVGETLDQKMSDALLHELQKKLPIDPPVRTLNLKGVKWTRERYPEWLALIKRSTALQNLSAGPLPDLSREEEGGFLRVIGQRTLRVLDLTNGHLTFGEDFVASWGEWLNLEALHLKGNAFSKEGVAKFAEIAPYLTRLRVFSYDGMLEPLIKGRKVISDLFANLSQLSCDAMYLPTASDVWCSSFLESSEYFSWRGEVGFEQLNRLHSLTALSLVRPQEPNWNQSDFFEGLSEIKTLTRLAVTGCALRDQRVALFSQELKGCTELLELSLTYCEMDETIHLAEALKQLKQLSKIDLSCNRLGDLGAETLSGVIPKLKNLHFFSLCSNLIGDSVIHKFVKKVIASPSLSIIDLTCNHTGSEGISPIYRDLQYLSPLPLIYLSSNDEAGDVERKALSRLCRSRWRGPSSYLNS